MQRKGQATERTQPQGRGSATEEGLSHRGEISATERGLTHRRGPRPQGRGSASGGASITEGGIHPLWEEAPILRRDTNPEERHPP